MTPTEITDERALAEALAGELFLLFKHSRACPTSAFAFAEYRAFVEAQEDVPTAWLDVIARRPLSLAVADETGVRHESPQALLFREGKVVWDASHGAITSSSLAEAVAKQNRSSLRES